MKTSTERYLTKVMQMLSTGRATELVYRPALQEFFESLLDGLKILNDPARSEHGNPDFVFLWGDLTSGYAETKDIGADLDRVERSEQMRRYFGYSNLILTDYLDFRFFRNGERYGEPIVIGILSGGVIVPKIENFALLERTISDFFSSKPETIRSGERLAKIMGGKARRIRENVARYVSDSSEKSGELKSLFEVMKKLLVHDLSTEAFADMYAQTLVYGLFVARYHDETPETFTRQEARDLVPDSNPLLRHFFDHIAGANFDRRLGMIVDELCEVFSAADVREIMERHYGKMTLWGERENAPDPVIHFYEDFLKEYDPEQRVRMGAFYTPLPVVRFIVRSVDAILKRDFDISGGLSDTRKIETVKSVQGRKHKESVHEVQVLDPATGTGTFLNETIRFLYQGFSGQEGRWSRYVDDDLLPRIHGFELMMAPYTIAHLKLGMTLRETGYTSFSRRLGIYLTNSLEEGYAVERNLFESLGFVKSVAEESRSAATVKNDTPIMIVLGNPPYSVASSNRGEWIQNLIADYKKNLNERKINLDDDYIKFLRLAEHFVEKNKRGVVAMITNNSFLDGVTHREMRRHLLETFDDIFVLDLHGNAKKKETTLDGGKDENVFDIQQGVSITLFVRTSRAKKKLGSVSHAELFGLRKEKYAALADADIEKMTWKKLRPVAPYYFFVPKDFSLEEDYAKGFRVDELFRVYSSGIETQRDSIAIQFSEEEMKIVAHEFLSQEKNTLVGKYDLHDGTYWKFSFAKDDLMKGDYKVVDIVYRPFDIRKSFYTGRTNGIMVRPRNEVMQHLLRENVALVSARQFSGGKYFVLLITNKIIERSSQPFAPNQIFPLYLYHEDGTKTENFNREIFDAIKKNLSGEVTPEDVFDYMYAALHSPSYREKYKEFLKIDFPRVPYPESDASFRLLVAKGRELCGLHLMESPKLREYITTFPIAGSNVVEKVSYRNGKVFINETQYFGSVPEIAWNFFVGGYQPAQKWLKDRKGRTLGNADLEHWQKIIVALVETDRIMKEIDSIDFSS